MNQPAPAPSAAAPFSRWGRGIAIASVLTVLCFAGLTASTDIKQVAGALRTFEWKWFVAALGLSMGNYVIRGVRWHLYLRRISTRISLWENIVVSLAGMVMTVTPGKAGEVLKSFMLKWSCDVGIAETAPIVVAERVTDLVALILLGAWGALLLPHGGVMALVSGVACVGLFMASTFRPLGDLLLKRLLRLPVFAKKADRLESAYAALVNSMSPGMAAVATLLSLVAWFLQVVAVVCIAQGLSAGEMSWQGASLIYCAPLVLGVASFLPGGIGVTEIGMSGLMQAVVPGFPAADSAVLIILVRTATLWWAVLVGAIALVLHRQFWGWDKASPAKVE